VSLLGAGWRWLAGSPRARRGLRVLQVVLGTSLLVKMVAYLPLADALWGPRGIGRDQSFVPAFGPWIGGWADRVFATPLGTHAVFVAVALGAVGLVAGTEVRLSTIVALLGLVLLRGRFHFVQGDDDVTYLALAYMLLTLPPAEAPPAGAVRVWLHNIGVLAIATQAVLVYFVAGFSKAFGSEWQTGTAFYYVGQADLFSSPLLRALSRSPWATGVASYVTVVYSLLFPAAVLSPLRVPWLVLAMTFHVLTGLLMGLWLFGTVMVGMDLFLISDAEYAALGRWARARLTAPGPLARLYIDGFCGICRSTARLIARLDWCQRLEIVSFRDPECVLPPGVTLARLETEMTLLDLRTGRAVGGFEAVRALARHLPALWPLRPLFAAVAWGGWGDRAYRYLAERRKIVPDPRVCRAATGADAECAPRDELGRGASSD